MEIHLDVTRSSGGRRGHVCFLTCLPWLRKNSPVFSMTCSSERRLYGCSLHSMNISQRVTPNAQTSLAVVNLPCGQKGCCKPGLLTAHIQQEMFQSTLPAATHEDAEFVPGKMLSKNRHMNKGPAPSNAKGTRV